MVSLALGSRDSIQHVKVDDTLLLQPIFGLANDYSLALGHFDCHTTSGIVLKEFSLGLIQLLCHRGSNCILVHEQVIPISFIIKICLENLLFFFLVIGLLSRFVFYDLIIGLFLTIFFSLLGQLRLLIFVLWVIRRIHVWLLLDGRRLLL